MVHPTHYNACGQVDADGSSPFEAVKVIEAWGWGEGFCCGNAIKYILRAPHKGSERLDLEKALWYLRRLEAAEHTVSRRQSGLCGAMRVANAWELPGRLQRALEHIERGECADAATEIEKHLAEEG